MKTILTLAFFCIAVTACQNQANHPGADTIAFNGRVYTVNADQPWAEAFAVRDGVFVAVGSDQDVMAHRGADTQMIDLAAGMALPGFHDSHLHPLEGGYLARNCDLGNGSSIELVLSMIETCAESHDRPWILGNNLDLALFPPNGPDKALLDAIAGDRNIYIEGSDGHTVWVNSHALQQAGITADTADPEAGVIERREGSREASGTLRETAMALVGDLRPPRQLPESIDAMQSAIAMMNATGITSVIDAWSSSHELKVYKHIDDSGELTLRVHNSITDDGAFEKDTGQALQQLLINRADYESPRIKANSVKMFVDGVMEGETASLLQPYLGLGHKGTLNYNREDLWKRVARYESMGLQIHMHTLGDGAAKAGLDALEYAREKNTGNPLSQDLRHHLSHLQLVGEDDIARFAALNTSANFTGVWAFPDTWVTTLNLPVLGQERVDAMYPIKAIVDTGANVVFGSDWIYGELAPLSSIEVAITRQDPHDSSATPGATINAIDLATAIKSYTLNGAWLMHQEDLTGSIEVGKRADVVVLEKNLFDIPARQISETKIQMTLFDGDIVYQDGNSGS
ncbi:MAG: amidohydrolase [Halioglobus sp.]